MTIQTKKLNEQSAYQLGWMAYERGDTDCFPESDEAFLEMCEESLTCESESTIMRAYNRGFDDAMVAAIGEME